MIPINPPLSAKLWSQKVDLDTLLASADIICLCANLTEESYHMIGSAEIAKMKDGVYLSNSARGALIDEEAMIAGLESGKIAGLGTDVLEEEPGRKNHPYLAFENVVMTPHTSAYTMECLQAMGENACKMWKTWCKVFTSTGSAKKSVVTLVKKEEEHVN